MKLVIGNKNYSSWSLRPWLAMRAKGIAFDEERVALNQPQTRARLLGHSPSGKVPVLVDEDIAIWDSLAIVEYLAEKFPQARLWPTDRVARARARSVTAEMHSGFSALRNAMPMNCRGHHPGKGRTPEVESDIARITALWEDCRSQFGGGGDFLFGAFCIADAFYAPVVSRFKTYGVSLPAISRQYADTMLALPAMQEWLAAAQAEAEIIEVSEPYR